MRAPRQYLPTRTLVAASGPSQLNRLSLRRRPRRPAVRRRTRVLPMTVVAHRVRRRRSPAIRNARASSPAMRSRRRYPLRSSLPSQVSGSWTCRSFPSCQSSGRFAEPSRCSMQAIRAHRLGMRFLPTLRAHPRRSDPASPSGTPRRLRTTSWRSEQHVEIEHAASHRARHLRHRTRLGPRHRAPDHCHFQNGMLLRHAL